MFEQYFEIQTELVKSSKLDLDLGSNPTKSNKTREDFWNWEISVFWDLPAYDYPESGLKLIMSGIREFSGRVGEGRPKPTHTRTGDISKH